MAISASYGYDGEIDETAWSGLATIIGTPYAVAGESHCKPTVLGGADRTVRIAAGTIYGKGVLDINDGNVNVQLPVQASGSTWYAVVCRRNWMTNTTTFTHVAAGSSPAWPAAAKNTGGTEDDQPIALVRITAGQQLPTELRDLRAFPSKVITANAWGFDKGDREVGTFAFVNNSMVHCRLVDGSPTWVNLDTPVPVSGGFGSSAAGWVTTGNFDQKLSALRGTLKGLFRSRRSPASSVIEIGSNGAPVGGTFTMFTLDAAYRPSSPYATACYYYTVNGNVYAGTCVVQESGIVQFINGSPNTNIRRSGTELSVAVTIDHFMIGA